MTNGNPQETLWRRLNQTSVDTVVLRASDGANKSWYRTTDGVHHTRTQTERRPKALLQWIRTRPNGLAPALAMPLLQHTAYKKQHNYWISQRNGTHLPDLNNDHNEQTQRKKTQLMENIQGWHDDDHKKRIRRIHQKSI
jgi:hypothetical protein